MQWPAKAIRAATFTHRSSEMVEEGAKVLIWYDPAHPNRCSYHKPGAGAGSLRRVFLDDSVGNCVVRQKQEKRIIGAFIKGNGPSGVFKRRRAVLAIGLIILL